MFKFLEKL